MTEKFSLNLAVRKLCLKNGLSIHQLAARCGDKQRVVYQNINRDSPSIATCESYADALDVSLLKLISEGYTKSRIRRHHADRLRSAPYFCHNRANAG